MLEIIIILAKRTAQATIPLLLALQGLIFPTAAKANNAISRDYLQCVPYARETSGIQIYGDAHTWWRQARYAYQRGQTPQVGAILSLKSHGRMKLGHVAVVSRIIDDRHILLDHANWSPINGRRGQIELGVPAIDVSAAGDWSEVRIWYAPISALGKTAFPANGFIYPGNAPDRQSPEAPATQWAGIDRQPAARTPRHNLLASSLRAELDRTAAREERTAATSRRRPADLIGELLDSVGE